MEVYAAPVRMTVTDGSFRFDLVAKWSNPVGALLAMRRSLFPLVILHEEILAVTTINAIRDGLLLTLANERQIRFFPLGGAVNDLRQRLADHGYLSG